MLDFLALLVAQRLVMTLTRRVHPDCMVLVARGAVTGTCLGEHHVRGLQVKPASVRSSASPAEHPV
jgi:hypothetical protein